MARTKKKPLNVETLTHESAKRSNIPTAEFQSVMDEGEQNPIEVAYERRNRDMDPQLVWRGKDVQTWSDLVVQAPPLYIQEKIHPKVLIDDLQNESKQRMETGEINQTDLFSDFNGLPSIDAATEFYKHQANWTNRMILGDSLQVMASLAEREGLRGQVQCIYLDPPYGIKFNSNFQWSTTSRDVKDGNRNHISREPEQVKAFRDTWRDGIHSYLTYLRDRLTIARDLLHESGSIFLQIGDENVHRVRALMDEVFGEANFISEITTSKTSGFTSSLLANINDFVLWYSKDKDQVKYRPLFNKKNAGESGGTKYRRASSYTAFANYCISPEEFVVDSEITSEGSQAGYEIPEFLFQGKTYKPPASRHWTVTVDRLYRVDKAGRVMASKTRPRYIRKLSDFDAIPMSNIWTDIGGIQSRSDPKVYVVQTATELIKRCILMTTDPGDLILDPTCGSGTTAYVSEQWGRRWITIETSRVALALARARIMGARYPYYILSDSREGQIKVGEIRRKAPLESPTHGDIRQGFVYERVPHITLKTIADNAEIDVIFDQYEEELEQLKNTLNKDLGKNWGAWEIPREANSSWTSDAKSWHKTFWEKRTARQCEIDSSIAANADSENLYDKPYEDKSRVRVAGPLTVESLSPHRILTVDQDDQVLEKPEDIDGEIFKSKSNGEVDFSEMVLEHLKTSGVQQAHQEDKIQFSAVIGWPGEFICAEGKYLEDESSSEKRAGIFIGPEFGTVSRPDLVKAAREAAEAEFDILIGCGFNFDAHASEFDKLGRIPVLKARMNADLHMADDLKNTGKGNLFVIFGEPDITIQDVGEDEIQVSINGVDVFRPQTGEIVSSDPDDIACWFIDTDYNEESFFVRHAYFLGASDPYKALKTTLKAEIDREAWESLHSDTSRPFDKPKSGRIAVKVINHLGDEVMKVFSIS